MGWSLEESKKLHTNYRNTLSFELENNNNNNNNNKIIPVLSYTRKRIGYWNSSLQDT